MGGEDESRKKAIWRTEISQHGSFPSTAFAFDWAKGALAWVQAQRPCFDPPFVLITPHAVGRVESTGMKGHAHQIRFPF